LGTQGTRNSTYRSEVTGCLENKNKRKPKIKPGAHGVVVQGSTAGVHGRRLVVAVNGMRMKASLAVVGD
jgi:hypothetical protein